MGICREASQQRTSQGEGGGEGGGGAGGSRGAYVRVDAGLARGKLADSMLGGGARLTETGRSRGEEWVEAARLRCKGAGKLRGAIAPKDACEDSSLKRGSKSEHSRAMKNVGGKRDAQQPRMVGDLLPLAAITAGGFCSILRFVALQSRIQRHPRPNHHIKLPPTCPSPTLTHHCRRHRRRHRRRRRRRHKLCCSALGDGVGTIEKPQNM